MSGTIGAEEAQPLVKTLLQEKMVLVHSWQLSHNYAHGLSVEKDPFKALAWQYVYVTLLPHAYPGLASLLKPFKAKVPDKLHNSALEYAKSLIKNYQLPSRMDENQLIRVFRAKESDIDIETSDSNAFKSFHDFLISVAAMDKAYALRYKNLIQTLKEEKGSNPLVYGQIVVNGGELPEVLFKNQHLYIDHYGFFVGEVSSPLMLNGKGYFTYEKQLPLNSLKEPISLGKIVLNPIPNSQRSSIVGNVFPANKINSIGLTLQLKDQYINEDEPWFTPTLKVTTLANGQFYIKDLSPGRYELIINDNNIRIKKEVEVGFSKVKTLSTIML